MSPADGTPRCAAPPAGFAALVDNVRSAFNVGSILRTAEGVGVRHVYLCGISAPASAPKVAKTALGAEGRVPWSHHRNARELADELIGAGHELWAIEIAPGSASLFDAPPPTGRTIAVIGNELAGIDPALVERCARVLHIGMAGSKSSFNVAVAFGIAAAVLGESARR